MSSTRGKIQRDRMDTICIWRWSCQGGGLVIGRFGVSGWIETKEGGRGTRSRRECQGCSYEKDKHHGTDSSNTTSSTDKTKSSAKKQQKTPPNERITDVIFKISPRALTHSIPTHATPTETFAYIVFECYRWNRLDTIHLRFVGYCLDFAGNSPLEDSCRRVWLDASSLFSIGLIGQAFQG